MAQVPAETPDAACRVDLGLPSLPSAAELPALDTAEFHELSDIIGEDGVTEMVHIFEVETRQRLVRLRSGVQDLRVQAREMHTLKGAAATVASPRLAALGLASEQAARRGAALEGVDFVAIEEALEAFLTELRVRESAL
jgi:HPt (histidine-containing phosphotransfer) domain-containing protein